MPKILVTGGPVSTNLDAVKIITNRFKGGLSFIIVRKGDEAVMPTFEIADNPLWSGITGEYIGNFDDSKPGIVRHLRAPSFYLWMTKAGLDDFDVVVGKYGLIAQFEFEGKKHQIPECQIPYEYTWEEIEKVRERLDYYRNFGPMMIKMAEAMKRKLGRL